MLTSCSNMLCHSVNYFCGAFRQLYKCLGQGDHISRVFLSGRYWTPFYEHHGLERYWDEDQPMVKSRYMTGYSEQKFKEKNLVIWTENKSQFSSSASVYFGTLKLRLTLWLADYHGDNLVNISETNPITSLQQISHLSWYFQMCTAVGGHLHMWVHFQRCWCPPSLHTEDKRKQCCC